MTYLLILFALFSIKNASNKTGINASSIVKCCKDKHKQAGGFYWEYIDNYTDNLGNIKKV